MHQLASYIKLNILINGCSYNFFQAADLVGGAYDIHYKKVGIISKMILCV